MQDLLSTEAISELLKITGKSSCEDCWAEKLAGDASAREYLRVHVKDWLEESLILMRFDPSSALTSEEFTGKSGSYKPSKLPFLIVQEFLFRLDLPVPKVWLDSSANGRVWLQDLGDELLFVLTKGANREELKQLYQQAIELLIRFQTKTISKIESLPQISRKTFDFELLRWELDHFVEWMIEQWHETKLKDGAKEIVDKVFDDIASRLAETPQIPTHRDYQSKNLILKDGTMYMIDFQDMLLGPPVYDLVALLRDSYVRLDDELLGELLEFYWIQAKDSTIPLPSSFNEFRQLFFLQTLQRKMKDSGRFVFIDRVKKNPSFLQYIPTSLEYVKDAFSYFPEYEEAQKVLCNIEERLCK